MSKLACLTKGKDRAFPAHPRIDRYFPARTIEDARNRLVRCIDRGDGPALVIGPTGTGKTLLLQLLATHFADRFSVACLTSTPMSTRRALLQAILFELRQPYRDRDESELRLALVELLLDGQSYPDGVLLLIDEAHLLPVKLLEELRALGNLSCAGEPRIRLVLAGSLQLDEIFAAPELEVFSQRLVARCYLAPLTHRETIDYTRAHIAASGMKPDELFTLDALDALYQATDGIPRLLNQVCDRALLLAAERGLQRIDKALIEAAWSDFQQLPTPWSVAHEPAPSVSPGVIEFGTLDDGKLSVVEPPTSINAPDPAFTAGPTMRVFDSSQGDALQADGELERDRPSASADWPGSPFAEPFAEEEVVLDRFASLEAAFGAQTPRVCNRRERGWSQMLSEVEINSSTTPQDINRMDEPEPLLSASSDQTQRGCADESGEPVSVGTADDVDVLCIEDDVPAVATANRQVERRDYRQLFASLRGD